MLDQPPRADESVDGGCCGVGCMEERLAVDLADEALVDLRGWIGPEHLQVEHEPSRPHCFDHVAQDVHDVLRGDSSE